MSTVVNDRLSEPADRFNTSRQRFIARNRKHVKKAVEKAISNGKISDIGNGDVSVTVPKDDLRQPKIRHGKGGVNENVVPGNKHFNGGERLPRPEGGGGGGGGAGDGEAGNGEDGQDDFVFNLTKEEFQDLLFADLQLPNLVKQGGTDENNVKYKREGFSTEGPLNKMDLSRSFQKRQARHLAFKKKFNKQKLELREEQYNILNKYNPDFDPDAPTALDHQKRLSLRLAFFESNIDTLIEKFGHDLSEDDQKRMAEIDDELESIGEAVKTIRPWTKSDLSYKRYEAKPNPTTQAAMFCLMDVSGSMDQEKKNNAKLFYMLLHDFLQRNYDKVDLIFVRHTTEADEVDEEKFFYDTKSGGTIVSSGIQMVKDIMEDRYAGDDWNVYCAQASDGDNWGNDTVECVELLREMMPAMQGYFYTEVEGAGYRSPNTLMEDFEVLKQEFPGKFFSGEIKERTDIFPVFRKFFETKETYASHYQPGPGSISAFTETYYQTPEMP